MRKPRARLSKMRHARPSTGPAAARGYRLMRILEPAVLLIIVAALGFCLVVAVDYVPHRLILIVRH